MFDRAIRAALLLVATALLPGVGAAQDTTWGQPGFYVGLSGNAAFPTGIEQELEDLSGVSVDVDPSLGLHARAGYRFHPHFAAEAHYEWISGFDVSVSGFDVLEVEGHAVTADVKGYLLTGRFQPFAVVGLGTLTGEVSDAVGAGFSTDETDFAARIGAGIDAYLTENLALTLDGSYVMPTGDLEDFNYFSLGWGLQYSFGAGSGFGGVSVARDGDVAPRRCAGCLGTARSRGVTTSRVR